jgi:hypothetical protein
MMSCSVHKCAHGFETNPDRRLWNSREHKVNEDFCCQAIYKDVTALFTSYADANSMVNMKAAGGKVVKKKCCCGRPDGMKGNDLCKLVNTVESTSWFSNENGCKQLAGEGYHNYLGTMPNKCKITQLEAEALQSNILKKDEL